MKKVAVVVRNPEDIIKLKAQLSDFTYDEDNPDFVISFGGDGTYLVSERLYPAVPKLIVKKDPIICKKCSKGEIYHLIKKIHRKQYDIKKMIKLKSTVGTKKVLCTNDFVVRNKFPTHALRFKIKINNEQIHKTLIGDGVVVSTPFGSTAYHYSITKSSFKKGIGIAFNNITKPIKHKVVDESSNIEIEIVRGQAVFAADNNPEIIELIEGQKVLIEKAKQKSFLINVHK
ncbi:MAG: Bifunctional NADP phosphatase/NAD kinase [Candidatus Woesearchaeota archaeon]|nr:Bifunctional NADP phosphatase/NAD kinase [Candidatus Woesearchaeota archaeon]